MNIMQRKIIDDYESGFGLRKLAVKFHFGHARIRRILVENNIKIRKAPRAQRKPKRVRYLVDLSGLSYNSEEIFSYWLGFVVSKGYMLHKNGSYRIELRLPKRDIGHLFLLVRDFRLNRIPTKRDNYVVLTIYNKELFVLIYDYYKKFKNGIVSVNNLDKRHWLRGLFDGHGSIIPGKYLRIRFFNRNESILEFIRQLYGGYVEGNYLCFNGKEAINLGRHLYCNCARYLQRKADIVRDCLSENNI